MTEIPDRVAAAAFRRLLVHLRQRDDAHNIDLMGLAGFCRNCLSEWVEEESAREGRPIPRAEAREAVYGMPYDEWKKGQPEASAAQLARMEESLKRNEEARR